MYLCVCVCICMYVYIIHVNIKQTHKYHFLFFRCFSVRRIQKATIICILSNPCQESPFLNCDEVPRKRIDFCPFYDRSSKLHILKRKYKPNKVLIKIPCNDISLNRRILDAHINNNPFLLRSFAILS